MTEIQTKVLRRVRKMMQLAEDAGASEGERDNALRMVHATLAKYNISLSQVEAVNERAEEPRDRLTQSFLGKPWALQIAAAIARLYFCHYYYQAIKSNGGPAAKANHVFIGRYSNVVTAQEMARFVVESVNREAQRYQRSIGGRYGDYRAFAQGAMMRIRQRCEEIQHTAAEQGVQADTEDKTAGTALVVANLYRTEEQANRQWLAAQGVKLRTGRSSSLAPGAEARAAGMSYGAKVSLHKQVK